MIPALRSEFRKLMTLRSTYVILGLGLLLVILMDGWVNGYKHLEGIGGGFLARIITSTIQGTSFLLGLIILLQITQEYRHNTIYHTLTLIRHRKTVVFAKAIVASLTMLAGAGVFILVGVACGVAGLAASGEAMGAQSIAWGDIVAKGAMYIWGAGMFALILGLLLRNQVSAIVMYLFGVNIAEQLLSLLLKSNAGYLPFRALEGVIVQPNMPGLFSPEKSMVIVLAWIVAGGAAAWFFFERRDAN